MNVSLQKILLSERDVLEKMMWTYFEEIDLSKITIVDNNRVLDYPYLDLYWTEERRLPFFILLENEIAGFAMINNHTSCDSYQAERSIAEFYIKDNFRRKGIGKAAAVKIFDSFYGAWEVMQDAQNEKACSFWRNTISEYTSGNYLETIQFDDGREVHFQLFGK